MTLQIHKQKGKLLWCYSYEKCGNVYRLASVTGKGGKMVSQNQMLYNYIAVNRIITQREALRKFGIMRLASRINDLRNLGHDIETRQKAVKNRFGKKVLVAEYHYQGDTNDTQTL